MRKKKQLVGSSLWFPHFSLFTFYFLLFTSHCLLPETTLKSTLSDHILAEHGLILSRWSYSNISHILKNTFQIIRSSYLRQLDVAHPPHFLLLKWYARLLELIGMGLAMSYSITKALNRCCFAREFSRKCFDFSRLNIAPASYPFLLQNVSRV